MTEQLDRIERRLDSVDDRLREIELQVGVTKALHEAGSRRRKGWAGFASALFSSVAGAVAGGAAGYFGGH